MAIIAQELSIADYNKLDNIPVINQDLTASGFTPVANTYYRHTGTTTDTFTQGVIYLYDTAYHKLGESGGGTTLNQYMAQVDCTTDAGRSIMYRILKKAKKISYIINIGTNAPTLYALYTENGPFVFLSWIFQSAANGFKSYTLYYNYNSTQLSSDASRKVTIDSNGYTISQARNFQITSEQMFKIAYENDTEIT